MEKSREGRVDKDDGLNSKGKMRRAAGVRCVCGNGSGLCGGGGRGVPEEGLAQHNAIPLMISHSI